MRALFVGGAMDGRGGETLLVADKTVDGEQYRAWIETKEGLRLFVHGEARVKCRFVVYALESFDLWQVVQKLIESYQPNTMSIRSSHNGRHLQEPEK